MGEKGSLNKEVESEIDLEEVREIVKEEVKEKEPDKEWQATDTDEILTVNNLKLNIISK